MIRFLLLTALAAGTLCPARATILTEVGDFSDNPFDPAIFILSIGSNIVSGTLEEEDRDYIQFVVPPGESVTSQQVIAAEFGGVENARFGAWSCEFDVVVDCTGSNVGPSTLLPFTFALGEIREGIQFSATTSLDDCVAGCAYTAEVFVGERPGEEVPEPTTWTLLATGLAGVMWRRRRRATNRL